MIPEEDRAPAWLRGYGDLRVDFSRLDEFAAALEDELMQNYLPHLQKIKDDMAVALPPGHPGFGELTGFLASHHAAKEDTTLLMDAIQRATQGFATAARQVAESYQNTDAFAAAQFHVVNKHLDENAVLSRSALPSPASTPTPPPTSQHEDLA
ncbi:hypothetical protein ACK8GG_03915 [Micromonosporaceae bacterium DT55]|uniref:hypothetical protein n=1 Tax=Melissospora conviva TaxID=3388432 RepID=UPI003C250764